MALLNSKIQTPSKVERYIHPSLSNQAKNKLSNLSKHLNKRPFSCFEASFRQKLIQVTAHGDLSLNDYSLLKETAQEVCIEEPHSEDAKLACHVLKMLKELKADEDIYFILPSLKTHEQKYPRTRIQFVFLPVDCA